MNLGLEGRVAIITGASKGIGRATAEMLAHEGARLVLCARNREPLEAVGAQLKEAGGDVRTVAVDVTDPTSSRRLRDEAMDEFGRIDVVVHGAGGSSGEHLRKFSDESWMASYSLNTLSAIRLSMECIPIMQERGWGRIVTIASTAARDPDPRFALYGAAKAALMHASRAMSLAYAKHGVLTNCILPGLTRSESVLDGYAAAAEHMGVTPEDVERRMLELQPISMGRPGEPEEVAAAIVFLCSEAASWITGAQLLVDGGTIRSLP